MNKEANTNYPINELIKKRWSPRSFQDKAVTPDQIKNLVDAARWAASSYNEQPWRFIVGLKGDDTYDKILDCLVEWNQNWANGAPFLMLGFGKQHFSHNDSINRHRAYDLGQSVATMTIQATDMGLHMHQMAGYSRSKVLENFNVPEEYEPIVAIAGGYVGEPEDLADDYRESELAKRKRKGLEEILFHCDWEKPF